MGYPSLTPACGGLLKTTGSGLELLKSTFNAKNFIMQVVLVYLKPFRCNLLLKCVLQPKIAKKDHKSLILVVHGRSRSLIKTEVNRKVKVKVKVRI